MSEMLITGCQTATIHATPTAAFDVVTDLGQLAHREVRASLAALADHIAAPASTSLEPA